MMDSDKIERMREIQVIVVDVDGTITDEKGLLDVRAIDKIRELERKGITVSLASGNALPVTKALASYIGASGPVIAESGCVIELLGEIWVYGDPEPINMALDHLKRVYGDRIRESWSNIYRHVDKAIRATIPIDELMKIVSRYDGVTILDSGFAYHLHPKDIDKGTALREASILLNLPQEFFMAIGDSELDIPMLEAAGIGVALGNAPDELREVADITIRDKYADGFLRIVDMVIREKYRGVSSRG